MFNIKEYLEKFQKLGLSDKENKEIISQTLLEILGIKINTRELEIKDSVLYIKTNPIIKNSLFIKKDRIIKTLKEKGVNVLELR